MKTPLRREGGTAAKTMSYLDSLPATLEHGPSNSTQPGEAPEERPRGRGCHTTEASLAGLRRAGDAHGKVWMLDLVV